MQALARSTGSDESGPPGRPRTPRDENSGPGRIPCQMAVLNITRDDFHGEWNYTIHPRA
jgi:hypothetical protein